MKEPGWCAVFVEMFGLMVVNGAAVNFGGGAHESVGTEKSPMANSCEKREAPGNTSSRDVHGRLLLILIPTYDVQYMP